MIIQTTGIYIYIGAFFSKLINMWELKGEKRELDEYLRY